MESRHSVRWGYLFIRDFNVKALDIFLVAHRIHLASVNEILEPRHLRSSPNLRSDIEMRDNIGVSLAPSWLLHGLRLLIPDIDCRHTDQ